jgi:hypothetical protein
VNEGGNFVGGDDNMSWVICIQVLALMGLG